MKTDELRESYLAFFESKGCERRPSDSLVPRDDPTVLFTPAGMNQFKNQFLGVGPLEYTRATTAQKCLRTGDIQNVGVTAYHHTFFEMLGNFSFGDYFKKDAIHWAWEYLTTKKWLNLPAEKLSVTVYKDDDEAYSIWHDEIGLDASRIRRDNEDENFWPASAPSQGPDGVCGPCSEIFYHPDDKSGEVEIWNLVFTQFNRVGDPPDNLRPLPKKNIDTGMGLERTASVMQGFTSNFEIDILKPLCVLAGDIVGVNYQFEASQGRPLRRIADHVRAAVFSIHEGVQPGSKEESYVVRQLLRRAFLEGYLLGKRTPFLHQIVPAVVEMMQKPYPELSQTVETVVNSIQEEETQFLDTVERGLAKFKQCIKRAEKSGEGKISGQDAFDLHQTDGFLIELTDALAAQHNLSVDHRAFDKLMDDHKITSGSGTFVDSVMAEGPLDAIRKTAGGTHFEGYDFETCDTEVVGIIAEKRLVDSVDEVGHTDPIAVVLKQSPFYGEAGGQVGDTGWIEGKGIRFQVIDTKRDGELLLHIGHLKEGTLKSGATVTAKIDSDRRAGIKRAHSATHVLHHALHQIVSESATQRGSKVEQDALRFDFAHKQALTSDEIQKVEDVINACIAEGSAVQTKVMNLDEAKGLGAMALFGEKYADEVRVVSMGDFSVELCGGTHLENTGQVGFCKIATEEPVAKGVRRITALTGPRAVQRIRETENLVKELSALLKSPQPEDLPKRIASLQQELREAKKQLHQHSAESAAGLVDQLLAKAEDVNGVQIVVCAPNDADRDMLRELIDQLRGQSQPVAILLAAEVEGKVALAAAVSKELVKQGVKASDCVSTAAKVVGGGGGGRPDMAEAGGRFPDKIDEALAAGATYYRDQLTT